MKRQTEKALYSHPAEMEPLLPCAAHERLSELARELNRCSDQLRSPSLHPITRSTVADLVRSMNSYCSNLIEGHQIKLKDIDAGIRKDFSTSTELRDLQIQHTAHMEVQAEMESRLRNMPAGDICSPDFLCWLHHEFYHRLPEQFRKFDDEGDHCVEPGKPRRIEVSVGRHLAPSSKNLDRFLNRFAEFYSPLVNADSDSLIAAAAAHQRLVWIHPFLDGNGRIARLFTHAWLIKAQVDSEGLWTISRGMAGQNADYRATLSNADEKRINDFDGRGCLSDKYLGEFCEFFLRIAAEQVEFMRQLISPDNLLSRIGRYCKRLELAQVLPRGSAAILRELFLRGEITRDDVPRIIVAPAETAQNVTKELLAKHLIASESLSASLRLEFPADATNYLFPNLYLGRSD